MARPAEAAFVFICAVHFCGSPGPVTTFSANDFEGGFAVNGIQVQIGSNSPTATPVSALGSFVDGAAKNTFAGSFVPAGTVRPTSETVFFTNPYASSDAPYPITTVLNWNYSQEGTFAELSGFVITGRLSATDLASIGITPSFGIVDAGLIFGFGDIDPATNASIQTYIGVPEPSTWAMTFAGFVGLGLAGYRRAREARAEDGGRG
jgi:hypothetical protein